MASLPGIYVRIVLPLLAAIALLSSASIVFLITGEPPRLDRFDSGQVLTLEIILLAVGGVLVPVSLMLARGVRKEPRIAVPIASAASLMIHMATLGEPTRTSGQGVTSGIAAVLSAVLLMISLLAFIESHDDSPSRSVFNRR